jgi:hypothetical protein
LRPDFGDFLAAMDKKYFERSKNEYYRIVKRRTKIFPLPSYILMIMLTFIPKNVDFAAKPHCH